MSSTLLRVPTVLMTRSTASPTPCAPPVEAGDDILAATHQYRDYWARYRPLIFVVQAANLRTDLRLRDGRDLIHHQPAGREWSVAAIRFDAAGGTGALPSDR